MSKRGRRNSRWKGPRSKADAPIPCETVLPSDSVVNNSADTPVSNGDSAFTADKLDGKVVHHVEGGDNIRSLKGRKASQQLGNGAPSIGGTPQNSEHVDPQVVESGGSVGTVRAPGLPKPSARQSAQNLQSQAQPASRELDDGYGDLDFDLDDDDDDVWSDKRELKLIELYRDCPFLWNKTLSSYQLRNKQEVSYTKFAEVLGVTCELLSLV